MTEQQGQEEGVDPQSQDRSAWIRFTLIFAGLALSFEILYHVVAVESEAVQPLLRTLARAAAGLLSFFYENPTHRGVIVSVPGFTVGVNNGCDGIQLCALLSAAVVAFPAPLRTKLIGIAVGLLWIQAWNVLRIASLLAIGSRFGTEIFETTHIYVWPIALIVISLASWLVWVQWATARDT